MGHDLSPMIMWAPASMEGRRRLTKRLATSAVRLESVGGRELQMARSSSCRLAWHGDGPQES